MYYVVAFLIGLVLGAICLFLYFMDWRAKVVRREFAVQKRAEDLESNRKELSERAATVSAKIKAREHDLNERISEVDARIREKEDHLALRAQALDEEYRERKRRLDKDAADVDAQLKEFERQIISYKELQNENALLKRDLQNIDVNLNTLQLDVELQRDKQQQLDSRSIELAKRYLSETVKLVVDSVGPNNFSACKQRLLDVIERCRDIGFNVSAQEETTLLSQLRAEFEKAVKAQIEREEQARIKAQIREEEKLNREVERELKQLERERAAIQAALDQALAEAHNQHTAEVDRLQARLAEAEEKKRAISMAQLTKAGNVYVISNIGSFGEGVFKIGMTRRLEPLDRVRELGDASVPFPFDVHMMISCTDAPSLENAVHRELHKRRMNKTNPRKEFFKTDIESICQIVREHHGEVLYVADPEALEYRQSLSMPEEDAEFIERVYDAADDAANLSPDQN